jgi:hypothetical protein
MMEIICWILLVAISAIFATAGATLIIRCEE